ncbi:hypothetical protein [Streptomyces sp. GESEQ-35]|nr:hypothetical protein [Streptomyces sp. GESEQ-35]
MQYHRPAQPHRQIPYVSQVGVSPYDELPDAETRGRQAGRRK